MATPTAVHIMMTRPIISRQDHREESLAAGSAIGRYNILVEVRICEVSQYVNTVYYDCQEYASLMMHGRARDARSYRVGRHDGSIDLARKVNKDVGKCTQTDGWMTRGMQWMAFTSGVMQNSALGQIPKIISTSR